MYLCSLFKYISSLELGLLISPDTFSDIGRIILYGSRAKGNYKPGSDINLCIEANVLELSDLLKIQNQIDDLLLPWLVDISFKHHIDNQHLLEHIDRVGNVFYMQSSE